ncbi:MAG: antitoxin family protein [Pirellulales bacterium]
MSQVINAIFENGVFRPLGMPQLADNERVRLTVDTVEPDGLTTGASSGDPLANVRVATGIPDLAENFDDYRFGRRSP